MKYKMRPTQQAKEFTFVVIIDGQTRWFPTRADADTFAQSEIADAAKGDYETTVFVLKCLMQNESE